MSAGSRITDGFKWVETRLDEGSWFRRGLAVATVALAVQLTVWSTHFASKALADKADLMGVAAVIGAVAGVPVVLLTLLFNKYVDSKS